MTDPSPDHDLLRLAESDPTALRELLDWRSVEERRQWHGSPEGLARFVADGQRDTDAREWQTLTRQARG